MSRLLSERWRIALCEDGWARVALSRSGRCLGDAEFVGAKDLASALASVSAWLASTAHQRKKLEFRLSNHFCRYAVVGWEPSIRTPEDLEIVAQAALEPLIEGEMDAWEIRLSPVRFEHASLACALPTVLVDQLHALCSTNKSTAASISPVLPLALQTCLSSAAAGSRILACLEGEQGWAIGLDGEEFLWIRAFAKPAEPAELITFLRRQQLLAGQSEEAEVVLVMLGGEQYAESPPETVSKMAKVHSIPASYPAVAMLMAEDMQP